MGKVHAVCISSEKGTEKKDAGHAEFIVEHGIKGDAHAGNWHRQVSLLSLEKIEAFRAKGADVKFGAFGENIVAEGFDFSALPVGTLFSCGRVLLEMTQIGKECHSHCAIFQKMGDCIMPREGVFSRVLCGGIIKNGGELVLAKRYRAGIITSSDKGARGEREDTSGMFIKELLEKKGYSVDSYKIISDEKKLLEDEMKRLSDEGVADLILTTGGTGFSVRDVTPEATIAVSERLVPGIPEAMRQFSMGITKRAMLSRAAAGIRGKTLIVNLPGSKKAVDEALTFIIDELRHGLDILTGAGSECGRV